jgi:hypothetical protein
MNTPVHQADVTSPVAAPATTPADKEHPAKADASTAIQERGGQAAALADRSIEIAMNRKSAGDTIKQPGPALTELCRRAARWASDNSKALKRQMPHLQGISDRAMDNWTPLFAIAEQCGGDWLQKAEAAALAIEPDYEKQQNLELLNMPDELRLLADIKAIFDGLDTEEILSADLIVALCRLPDGDWRKYRHGGPISQRGVAVLLAKFDLVSKKGGPRSDLKVWRRKDLEPAWSSYLPQAPHRPQAPQNGTHNADDADVAEQHPKGNGLNGHRKRQGLSAACPRS